MSQPAPHLTARVFLTPYGQLAASIVCMDQITWLLYYTISYEGFHCQGGSEYVEFQQANNQLMRLHQGDACDIALLLINLVRKETGLEPIERAGDHTSSGQPHVFQFTPFVLQ